MAAHISRKRRVLFAFLAATVLVAITSVPSMVGAAPAKQYSLAVSPLTATVGQPTPFTVTMTNVTPPGTNSNPSSFYVTVPFPISGDITSLKPLWRRWRARATRTYPRRLRYRPYEPEQDPRQVARCGQEEPVREADVHGDAGIVHAVPLSLGHEADLGQGDQWRLAERRYVFSDFNEREDIGVVRAPPSLSVTKTAVDASILVAG